MLNRINPTFLLKGINSKTIENNYNSGKYNRNYVNKNKITLSLNNTILAPKYEMSNKEGMYYINDKYNIKTIIATSNQKNFKLFSEENKHSLNEIKKCLICQSEFTEGIGYPIAYQEKFVLDTNTNTYKNYYIFWTEGEFCSFECSLCFIKIMIPKDLLLKDSENILKLLYKLTFGNDEKMLVSSEDPRLLECYGGCLSKEEWKSKKHTYTRTERIILLPAKVEYIQKKN